MGHGGAFFRFDKSIIIIKMNDVQYFSCDGFMARRTDHSRDDLRRLATDAALGLLEAGGVEAVTARAVAKAIGYAPGTIYNLYPNMDGLMLEVNAATLSALHAALLHGQIEAKPRKQLEALALHYMEFVLANPARWQALFRHRLPAGEPLPAWYAEKIDQLLELIRAPLAALQPKTEETEIADAAQALWAAMHGISELAVHGKLALAGNASPAYLARLLVKHFARGWKDVSKG
jgi:AcrR family transcriptional regulator